MNEEQRNDIIKTILMITAAAGIISMALIAPNTLQALDIFLKNDKKRKYNTKYYINKRVLKLEKQGLIKRHKIRGRTFITLTKKGEEKVLRYQLRDLKIKKPKKWDKKWRVIIFDIKEYNRKMRDVLRSELENLGFKKLQRSVWVFPYKCGNVVTLLKSGLDLKSEVLYMVVDKIENDHWLKEDFGLS